MIRAKNLEEVLGIIEQGEGVVKHQEDCTCLGCTIKPAIKEAVELEEAGKDAEEDFVEY